MDKPNVKGIPYGVANFEEVRSKNRYYVDKTMYLPLLEEANDFLFLIRPRRFGKSVFVSMMQAYYDIAKADRFETLFDGLWIKAHPTSLKTLARLFISTSRLSGAGLMKVSLKVTSINIVARCWTCLPRHTPGFTIRSSKKR